MLRTFTCMAALVVLLAPASARADWLFTPHLGTTFNASENSGEHFGYGVALGWMGAGIFGWEADLSYTPEFLAGDDDSFDFVDDSNVTTFMINAIVGAPFDAMGQGWRPYATAGVGLVKTRVPGVDQFFDEVDSNDWGLNVGGGIMGFMTDHVGFRGDLRYIRSFHEDQSNDQFDLDLDDFDFWRANVGITFRW